MESLDSEQLVIGYASSRHSPIDAGMALGVFRFFFFFLGVSFFFFGCVMMRACGGAGG
jgi:hypothetical protein